jgi:hypothetical protein
MAGEDMFQTGADRMKQRRSSHRVSKLDIGDLPDDGSGRQPYSKHRHEKVRMSMVGVVAQAQTIKTIPGRSSPPTRLSTQRVTPLTTPNFFWS